MFDKNIIIPSTLESINKVERIVDEISEKKGISAELYGKILVAVIEAVNNGISHGNKLDPTKNVKVDFNIDNNRLIVKVEYEGEGFNPNIIPDPTAPENIENISGRGVFIMQRYSDSIQFNDKGTQVTKKCKRGYYAQYLVFLPTSQRYDQRVH